MHHLSGTAVAARDSNLARRIRLDETMAGWRWPCTVEEILDSDDADTATSDVHPELGALGAMTRRWAEDLIAERLTAMAAEANADAD